MDIFPDGVLSERPEDQAAFVDAMLREFMSRGAEPENVFCDLVSMMMHWADLRGMNVDCVAVSTRLGPRMTA